MQLALTPDSLILQGKECGYCNKPTVLVDSKEVYGKSFGPIYLCKPCKAWVGVHKDQKGVALGRVAKAELRRLKRDAHKYFDNMWERKIEEGKINKGHARSKAYIWLSKVMGIDPALTHIGMFNEDQCRKVIQECKRFYKPLTTLKP